MTGLCTVLRFSPVRVLGIGLLVGLVVLTCRQFGVFEDVELSAYDWTVRATASSITQDPRIVLITITEEDLEHLGQWPVSDDHIAKALNILTEYGARTIGLDVYRDKEVPPGREDLNKVLTTHPEIVVVMKFPDQHGVGVPGPSVLQDTDQVGFNDILVDPGGIVRRGFLFLEDDKGTAMSFALILALRYLEKDGIVPHPDPIHPEFIRFGQTTVPRLQSDDGSYIASDARGYQMFVKFTGTPHGFTRFSLRALLSGEVPPESVRDKIVVIGSAAESVRDDFYTPFSLGQDRDQQVPGMELHAHIISQFLRMALHQEQPIRSSSELLEAGWLLAWGCLGAFFAYQLSSPWGVGLAFGGGIGVLILLGYGAFLVNWWIPLVPPAVAWVAAGGVTMAWVSQRHRQERKLVMQLFSQHVSAEIADTIWKKREQFLEEGRIRPQKLTATVLFADLEGFSAVAEQLSPQALMEWVNTYLTSLANVVSVHGGIVDDYFGDGIKANFGIPFARTNEGDIRQDAAHAVQCGLAMMHEMVRVNQSHGEQSVPIGKVRIGIATGPVVVGDIGGAHRLKYTTVGDVVNIAARLEQLGKDRPNRENEPDFGSLLITGETKHSLDDRWVTQEIGPVDLPGKREPVLVYRVLSGP